VKAKDLRIGLEGLVETELGHGLALAERVAAQIVPARTEGQVLLLGHSVRLRLNLPLALRAARV